MLCSESVKDAQCYHRHTHAPKWKWSLADQQLPPPGTRSLTISPPELDTRQRRAHVCNAVQVTEDERPRDRGIRDIPQALSLPTMRAVNQYCRAGRSWAVSLEQYKASKKESERNWTTFDQQPRLMKTHHLGLLNSVEQIFNFSTCSGCLQRISTWWTCCATGTTSSLKFWLVQQFLKVQSLSPVFWGSNHSFSFRKDLAVLER